MSIGNCIRFIPYVCTKWQSMSRLSSEIVFLKSKSDELVSECLFEKVMY